MHFPRQPSHGPATGSFSFEEAEISPPAAEYDSSYRYADSYGGQEFSLASPMVPTDSSMAEAPFPNGDRGLSVAPVDDGHAAAAPKRLNSGGMAKSMSNGNTSREDSETEQQPEATGVANTNWLRVYNSRRPRKPSASKTATNPPQSSSGAREYFQSFPQWYTGKHACDAIRREELSELYKTHGVDLTYEESNYSPDGQMILVDGDNEDDLNRFNHKMPSPSKTSGISMFQRLSGVLTGTGDSATAANAQNVSYDIYNSERVKKKIGLSDDIAYQQSPLRTHLHNLSNKKLFVNSPTAAIGAAAECPSLTALYGEQPTDVGMDERSTTILNDFKSNIKKH